MGERERDKDQDKDVSSAVVFQALLEAYEGSRTTQERLLDRVVVLQQQGQEALGKVAECLTGLKAAVETMEQADKVWLRGVVKFLGAALAIVALGEAGVRALVKAGVLGF